MHRDKNISEFLDNEFIDIWELIIKDDIKTLLNEIEATKSGSGIFSFFTRKTQSKRDGGVLFQIIKELFNSNTSPSLDKQKFEIQATKSDELFKNLTRLLFAISINGRYSNLENRIADKLNLSVEDIANEISIKADGYPTTSINAQVWIFGASMRVRFSYLKYYYLMIDNTKYQLLVHRNITSITLSIMSHYKNIVGPDMVELAEIEEKLGLLQEALAHYNAIILDFEPELENYEDLVDLELHAEERQILVSLKTACKNYDRINKSDIYQTQLNLIERILN